MERHLKNSGLIKKPLFTAAAYTTMTIARNAEGPRDPSDDTIVMLSGVSNL